MCCGFWHSRCAPRRDGIGLIELLVAIAIAVVLITITLAATQRVRSAADRARCADRLRQLALAAHNYHSARQHIPPGVTSDADPKAYPYLGWPARLLPYFEQDALWKNTEAAFATDPAPTVFYGHPPHAALLGTVVTPFLCPSDDRVAITRSVSGVSVAFTSYVGVEGRNQVRRDGCLFVDSRITWASITNGQSNTLLLAERPPAEPGRYGWWYRGWGQNRDGSGDAVLGARERNFDPDLSSCPPGPYHFKATKPSDPCGVFHYWSLHPGGAHFAFADGSVRFLTYSADDILPALATRAGGEVVEIP